MVVSPFFFWGQVSGHDFQFHIASWMDVARQWHEGVAFPRWAAWANYGYGEPRFIFYPPLSWCLGAGLGSLLPWKIVPGAFIFLALAFAGVSMHRLARAWMPADGAVAAAVLYAVNPYQLTLVYYRSDFAELLASAFLPLAVHHALRMAEPNEATTIVGRDAILRRIASLAIVYAAIWLTNGPAAVVTSYALAFLLVLCAALRRSFATLVAGAAALALGLLLACVYIIPAAYEQAWVNIDQAFTVGLRPAENFLFTSILNPEHNLSNLVISTVATVTIALAGAGAVVSHRRAASSRTIWTVMFALGALCTVLMFPVSGWAWQYAPELRFAQFPWRWLVPLGASFAFFLGEAVATSRRRLAAALACAAAIAATGLALTQVTWWTSDDLTDILEGVTSAQGYEGTYEYCTRGGDQTDLDRAAPMVVLLAADAGEDAEAPQAHVAGSLQIEDWRPERKEFIVDAPLPVWAAVRLLNYPAWQVGVNGRLAKAESDPRTAQMLVPLPAGRSRVEIRFARTADRTAGAALSGAAVLLLAGMAGFGWRRAPTQHN